MSKIAKEKASKYYDATCFDTETLLEIGRKCFVEGYDQSAKDTIERIRARIKKLRCQFGEVTKVDVFELLSTLEKEYE